MTRPQSKSVHAAQQVDRANSQQAYRLRRALSPQWSDLRALGWTGSYVNCISIEQANWQSQQSQGIADSVCSVFGHRPKVWADNANQCQVCGLVRIVRRS